MYLQIDEGFATHPKTMMFVGRMQDPNALAYLIKLWTWACRSAPTGDLSEMNAWAIEDVVGYRMLDGKCYAALAGCGFIDETEPGHPKAIHNWHKRTGGDIAKMAAEAQRKRNYRAAKPWDVLRLEILNRDDFTCKKCNDKPEDQSRLDVHHVVPLRKFEDKVAGNHPSNLITLCEACHNKADRELRAAERTAVGRRSDGAPPDDATAPGTANTDQSSQGKARQERSEGGSGAHARSNDDAGAQPVAPEKRRWPVDEWFMAFRVAWITYAGVGSYGGRPNDNRGTAQMRDQIARLSLDDALSAQSRAQQILAAYFTDKDDELAAAGHPWLWFVQRFDALRRPGVQPRRRGPAMTPGERTLLNIRALREGEAAG